MVAVLARPNQNRLTLHLENLTQVRQFDPNFDYFESFSDLKLT